MSKDPRCKPDDQGAARVAFERRHYLFATLALPLLGMRAGHAQPVSDGARRPFVDAAMALRDQARNAGDQPFGAVVVRDGRIVGRGPSRVISRRDPTAHAEMEAIRDACRRLGSRDLSGCVLYASFKPCPMCEAAAYWARVERFYHGADGADGGQPQLC